MSPKQPDGPQPCRRRGGGAVPGPAHQLTERQLRELRDLLVVRREALEKDLFALGQELPSSPGGIAERGDAPDCAAQAAGAEANAGLLEGKRRELREIEQALLRMGEGDYGVCVATGKPIGMARLRARPWAKYCIEYAWRLEARRRRRLGRPWIEVRSGPPAPGA